MFHSELKRIMYVEDELDIIVIAKIALEDMGHYQLQCCNSGKEALQVASSFKPQLFIIDVMMPEMDGLTTMHELRKLSEFKKTPVIFMTAKVQASEIQEYISQGAVDVISKPFDPLMLANHIQKIWDKAHAK